MFDFLTVLKIIYQNVKQFLQNDYGITWLLLTKDERCATIKVIKICTRIGEHT